MAQVASTQKTASIGERERERGDHFTVAYQSSSFFAKTHHFALARPISHYQGVMAKFQLRVGASYVEGDF